MKDNLRLIWQFARTELVDRYAGSMLGAGWSVIWPLSQIIIFVVVFSKIMNAKLSIFGQDVDEFGYSIYLMAGILPWMAFANAFQNITEIFNHKKSILTKVAVQPKVFFGAVLISESVIFALSTLMFWVFLWWANYRFDVVLLWLVPIYLVQLLFTYGLGKIVSILGVFYSDVQEVVKIGLQLLFWMTPIVYVVDILPEGFAGLMAWNPFYHFVEGYHAIYVHGKAPDLAMLGSFLLISLLLIWLARGFYGKTEKAIKDML